MEADGDEGEEEADVEGYAVVPVECGDDGVDKGAVCYDEGASECGLCPCV